LDTKALRFVTYLTFAGLSFPLFACGGEGSTPGAGDTIDRDRFVEAYYLLRREALRSPLMEISLSARDRILADLELTEQELIHFAEVWGEDGEVMAGIWQEVDSLLTADRLTGRERALEEGEEGDLEGSPIDFRGSGRG
jgi:hypothetical protein